MTKIRSEFFALPDEVVEWAIFWAEEFSFVVALDSAPLSGRWSVIDDASELRALAPNSVVFLTRADGNRRLRDALFLKIGSLDEGGLRPSFLGGETEDAALLVRWRALMSDFKKKTDMGLWLVDPDTRARAISKKMRYSQEAARRHQSGLRLRALAGWNVYELPASETSN